MNISLKLNHLIKQAENELKNEVDDMSKEFVTSSLQTEEGMGNKDQSRLMG